MPNKAVHGLISRMLVGNDCSATHKVMDMPYKIYQSRHRKLFHDPLSAVVLGFLTNGYDGVVAGLSHILADYLVTESKRIMRKYGRCKG